MFRAFLKAENRRIFRCKRADSNQINADIRSMLTYCVCLNTVCIPSILMRKMPFAIEIDKNLKFSDSP